MMDVKRRAAGPIVAFTIGAVLTVVGGLPMLILLVIAISAKLGPTEQDPHGYSFIFGLVLAMVCAIPTLIGVTLLTLGGMRLRQR